MAFICQDPRMLKAVADGLDFHTFTASAINGISYDDMRSVLDDDEHSLYKEYKAMRQGAKAVCFGILYGSSVAGIANTLMISLEEAEKLVRMYFDTFPGVKDYIDQTHAAAQLNQYVITPFGHRRQFYGVQPVFKGTAAYNAGLRGSQNYIIQSATSVIGAVVFGKISQEIKKLGGICTATVHDSIETEVPEARAAEAVEMLYYYMNDWPQSQYDWISLPIGCDVELGTNWDNARHVKRGTTQEEALSLLSTM